MKRTRIGTNLLALAALLVGSAGSFSAQASQAIPFAEPAFEKLWTRTDSLVASGQVKRSFYWGPGPITNVIMEYTPQVPGGMHRVQYFDKSRMEINDPNADKNNPFYVTNGLLTGELITGLMDTGGGITYRWPAHIPLGDNTGKADEITYASFRAALGSRPENLAASVGGAVQREISANGPLNIISPGTTPSIGAKYNLKYAYYESATLRSIPDVFWTFLNATGPVVQDGKQTTARLNEPYFYATGYPITDAYWAQLTVAGKKVDVLIQAYERRILTYVPSAPEGFKVQMGNIGLHYYDWRYKDAGKPPALAGTCKENPVRGFGKLYADNQAVKVELGCQQTTEGRETIVRQSFQYGEMVSTARIESYTNRLREDVYVLFRAGGERGGAGQVFQVYGGYTPSPNATPTPIPAPPNPDPDGLYTPTGTFGQVWQSPGLSAKLGKATAPPDVQAKGTDGAGGGVIQYFNGGLMVYPNLSIRRIYVLYNSSGYAYVATDPVGRVTPKTNIDRWAVYDDTYVP